MSEFCVSIGDCFVSICDCCVRMKFWQFPDFQNYKLCQSELDTASSELTSLVTESIFAQQRYKLPITPRILST